MIVVGEAVDEEDLIEGVAVSAVVTVADVVSKRSVWLLGSAS